jgi:ribosomal-protein-alanine N-acetyltransferase
MRLLTARLQLRPLGPDDLDALAAVYLHPRVVRWIGPQTRAGVAREIERQVALEAAHGWSILAIEERASGRLIGDCGLQPLEHRGPEVELGYDLHPDAWGRGLATEAARAVVAHALGPLAMARVIAVAKHDNVASHRVLEKAGLRRTGTRPAYGERMVLFEVEPRTPW